MKTSPSISQEEIIAFLCDPRSYPYHPKRVHFVQTHASYVILGSPYVFKVKKKVNLGFLDFSSLKNRRYYSEREVTLNRRLCPDIYLGVIPISLSAGKLAFGKGEKVVEYAVKMRKLQDRYFLLRLLRQDQVTTKDLDRIVSRLKDFYEKENTISKNQQMGSGREFKDQHRRKFQSGQGFCRPDDFAGGLRGDRLLHIPLLRSKRRAFQRPRARTQDPRLSRGSAS
jgi:aminoglycoside phosphotransferase family enzyme